MMNTIPSKSNQKIANGQPVDPRAAWKNIIRKYPLLSRIMQFVFDPAFVTNQQRGALLEGLATDSRVLNLGSGAKRIRVNIVNLDIEPFGNVDVVGDGQRLPFADGVFDLVLCEYVLEHIRNPLQMAREIQRVIKPGGQLYMTVPFMQTFHGNPDDYQRYTISGLSALFDDLETIECKPYAGPTSALCNMVKEYLAVVFSFNSKLIYSILSQLLIILVFPFKFIDYFLVRNINAHNLSFSLYFVAQKPIS